MAATPGAGGRPPAPSVRLDGITKRYGAVVACHEVDLVLHAGRIHGVLGENGAGKSTLMKILIGLVQPDAGHISVGGDRVDITDPTAAGRLGIAMVHQHYSLVDTLTVWENVVLGDGAALDRGHARGRVTEIGERYGLQVEADALVGNLTAGQRQRVEIIKCLRREPSIIVFDEPTSVLTPAESEQLFAVLRRVVSEEGRTVALVSHKLDEILHATDEITIMRSGRVVERLPTADATAARLAQDMVGRPVSLRSEAAALGLVVAVADEARRSEAADQIAAEVASTSAAPSLRVRNAVVVGPDGRRLLDGLSLDVRPGEILGLAGVEGNGQRVLADALSGLVALHGGTVEVNGTAVRTDRPGALHAAGIGVIPEDRHDSGCVLDMSVAENLLLAHPGLVATRGVLHRGRMTARARRLMAEFDIQAASPDAPMRSLSGGNQQRVVLARELAAEPKVLVAAQPTRGLDVGAIEYMASQLRAAAERGVAVLLVSTELEEILSLAHRICVIFQGRIVGELARGEATPERLGLLLGGVAA